MRLLHTMLRVGNLQHSLDFYINILGMKLLRQKDYPEGRFTLAFVGYGEEHNTSVLELTHNWARPFWLLLKTQMVTRLSCWGRRFSGTLNAHP